MSLTRKTHACQTSGSKVFSLFIVLYIWMVQFFHLILYQLFFCECSESEYLGHIQFETSCGIYCTQETLCALFYNGSLEFVVICISFCKHYMYELSSSVVEDLLLNKMYQNILDKHLSLFDFLECYVLNFCDFLNLSCSAISFHIQSILDALILHAFP